MSNLDFSGSADINNEGIKKHFKNYEPWYALSELAWNGFDANAKNVSITITENDLGGILSVVVLDDGEGIDFLHTENNFGQFNDSSKKEDAAQHGSHGRGRLAFHKLSSKATWYTRFQGSDGMITVVADSIKKFNGKHLAPKEQHASLVSLNSGTCVELSHINGSLPTVPKLLEYLATEFGWYLALNSDRSITVNGVSVPVPPHDLHSTDIGVKDSKFEIKVIRWDQRPTSEKSFVYLLNTGNKVLHKELSSFNNKANFFTSVYVSSKWADNFDPQGPSLLNASANTTDSPTWRALSREIVNFTQKVYDEFLRRFVDEEIERFDADGIFPEYKGLQPDYAAWKLLNTKALVKAIYKADPSVFAHLNKKQKKILVRFLDKLATSNENESLFDVLDSVLDLDAESMSTLADQLKRTKLEHIISTIEVLQKRQQAVDMLREVMVNHYKDVLETPDLQKIIENNTWLFGPQYETIGAEETNFTQIARNLRAAIPQIDVVSGEDVEAGTTLEGVMRQPDLFLARKFPAVDSRGNQFFRCILIEIKKPGVALNVKHLRQLEDYAGILKRHAAFNSQRIHFELILIGRKISDDDIHITSQLNNHINRGEMGLVSDDGNMKRYVKTWFTILDGFDLTNGFMLNELKLQRDSLAGMSKDELINDLQQAA